MGNNSSDDARFAYDFLEPVPLSPAVSAMDSCSTEYRGAVLIRLRRTGFRISHLSVPADMFAAVALEDGHNLDPSRYPSVPMRV